MSTSREYLVSTPEYRVITLAAQLFPDHPNLLASTWEPTAAMRADGYVTKPSLAAAVRTPCVRIRRGCIHPHATDAVAPASNRCAIISSALVQRPTGFRATLREL